MKAEYVKPELKVVDFEMNAAIAACNFSAAVFSYDDSCKIIDTDIDYDNNSFTVDGCTKPVKDYCYTTATDTTFNS